MKTPRAIALVLSLMLATSSVLAAASEPTKADRARARTLAREGFEALERKDYALAEARFRSADALVHAPSLVVDHARALTGLGRLVEAHERYELVLREGVAPDAPWQWKEALSDAARELELLKPRLSWLTLRVKGGPRNPVVMLDNKPVPTAALGVRRATDPGTHAVSVSARGFEAKEELVTLDEGQIAVLEIELAKAQSRSSSQLTPEPTRAHPRNIPSLTPPARDNTLAYVLLGAGALGLAGGAVTGFLFFDSRAELESECDDERVCRPDTEEEREKFQRDVGRYRLFGTLSAVGFGIAAVGAGAGGALLFLGRSSRKGEEVSSLKPYIGIGTVGLKGHF